MLSLKPIVGHFRHSPANDVELHTEQSKVNQKSESLIHDVPLVGIPLCK